MSKKNFCDVCNSIKPERAHHCRKCKRCVFLMDHHCVWVNNCVGLYNRKYFLLTLFYGVFALLLGIFVKLWRNNLKPLFYQQKHIWFLFQTSSKSSKIMKTLGWWLEYFLQLLFVELLFQPLLRSLTSDTHNLNWCFIILQQSKHVALF